MKRNTNHNRKRLGPETARLIRGMHGVAAQIAAVAKFKDRSYVSRVIAGEKPPSVRFLLALDCVLAGLRGRTQRAILEHEHPEIVDSASRILNSETNGRGKA